MKAKEFRKKLRDMSDEELAVRERDLREDLFRSTFKHGGRQLENTARLCELRQNLARVMTVRHEKRRPQ